MMIDTPPHGTPQQEQPDPPEEREGAAAHVPESLHRDHAEGMPSADLYRLLVESVQDYAIYALDPSGLVRTWSTGAARMKGYARTEILGRHFSIFYPPEDAAAGKPTRHLEIAARDGRFEEEGWRIRKDGSRFWANVVITALRDELGVLVGFAKITRDLSERRRTQEALRESEERFRLFVESVRDYAMFILDPLGRVATWNRGAERIKGYTAEEIIGKHFSIFYPQEKVAEGFPQYELKVAAQEGRFEDEGWRVRKDGSRFWANVVITALRDETGRLLGFAKVTRDLTARRAAEERERHLAAEAAARAEAERQGEELRRLNEQLRNQAEELQQQTEEAQSLAEELELANDDMQHALQEASAARAEAEAANQAKTEFLAAMSHELRTPLNAIGGYAQLLELGVRGPVSEQQRSDLERIRRSQLELTRMINEVLNYARLQSGRVTYDLQRTLVADVIASAAPLVEPQREAKRIALDVRLPEFAGQPPLYVLVDRDKLQQILLNLLSNAVKFTPAGGRISVELDAVPDEQRMAVLRVCDTGIGIPSDKLEAVFEPFVQVGRSLSNPGEGTGLGLAISRDLARGMGGELRAQSRVGEGSVFTLRIPAG